MVKKAGQARAASGGQQTAEHQTIQALGTYIKKLLTKVDKLTHTFTKAGLVCCVGYLTTSGNTAVAFIGFVNQKSGTGLALADVIQSTLGGLGVKMDCVFGLSTDGAAAMAGADDGTRAFLQQPNLNIY